MIRVQLALTAHTGLTEWADTIIPGVPRIGETVVHQYTDYRVTNVIWNDYHNSPQIGLIIEAKEVVY